MKTIALCAVLIVLCVLDAAAIYADYWLWMY